MMHQGSMHGKNNFLNGLPEMLVLRLLSRQEMYGYQLISAIRAHSGETFQFGEGCLYPILHKLTRQGRLTSRTEKVGGRQRNYYKASPKGCKYLEELTEEWTTVKRGAERILGVAYAG